MLQVPIFSQKFLVFRLCQVDPNVLLIIIGTVSSFRSHFYYKRIQVKSMELTVVSKNNLNVECTISQILLIRTRVSE